MWGQWLPTHVTQATPSWEPLPGIVRTQTMTQWEHGLELCQNVKVRRGVTNERIKQQLTDVVLCTGVINNIDELYDELYE